jgi:Flp pilus assembly pilin Flp
MNKLSKFVRQLHKDESGAALIEYTALAGILVAVTAAVFSGIGTDIAAKWADIASFFS